MEKKNGILVLIMVLIIISVVLLIPKNKEYKIKEDNITKEEYNTLSMFIVDGEKETPIETVPSASEYEIDETKSYCKRGEDELHNVLTTINNNFVFKELHTNDKCYLYFSKIKPKTFTPEERVIALGKTKQTGQTSFTDLDTSEHKDSNGNSIMYSGTDNDGTTYYFRGVVNDNWVKYGTTSDNKSIWWRIIRINGDGTIRLIYAGTTDLNSNTPPGTTGTGTQITVENKNTFCYGTSDCQYKDNKYVGYQYADKDVHGNGTDSYAADRANEWFKQNLLDEWNNGNGRIDNNAGFCADRTSYTNNTGTSEGGGAGTTPTYYATYIRFKKSGSWQNPQAPIFACINASDLFTYTGATKGTKSLTYPVGLITADEVVYAGGFGGKNNESYYLYTDQFYWTMSPSLMGSDADVFYVYMWGSLNETRVNNTYGVRPVISLKADTQFTGDGKSGSPFVIQ